MKDNDIIKALEICTDRENAFNCDKCVFFEYKIGHEGCYAEMLPAALDLINRKDAEIERYKQAMPHLEHQSIDFCGVLCDFAESLIAKAKAEAIKEFAERLKEKLNDDEDVLYEQFLVQYHIDTLVKEMTEGNGNA